MKRLNQRLFKCWIGLWVIILMIPTIFNQIEWLPLVLLVASSAFLLWWGLTQVCPNVNWEDSFDWKMAYTSIVFFGSMMAFLLPYSYGLEQSLPWNNWCQIFALIWLFSIIVALVLVLKEGWNVINNVWKTIIILVILAIAYIFTVFLLGICGIYLV